MKRNFLVTTGLPNTWEKDEINFLLGTWCEFYEFNYENKEKLIKEKSKKNNFVKNDYHWNDNNKKEKDYKYIKEKSDYFFKIISEKLSLVHKVNEDSEYWRIIIFNWITQYTSLIFDRWEVIRIFFEKNPNKNFYTNFILHDLHKFIPQDHRDFKELTQRDDWNHSVYLRILNYLQLKNLSLIKKDNQTLFNEKIKRKNIPFLKYFLNYIDKKTSLLAFRFNKVILESFFFPKKEYLKICFKCKLIPSTYKNIFSINFKEKKLSEDNKRINLKNSLKNINEQDKFTQFFLENISKDIPKSYLENFEVIKKKFSSLAKRKKIIFSMHSLYTNDNFKIYLAETKKNGSKYIHSDHGGGLTSRIDPNFGLIEKVSSKIIRWDNDKHLRYDNTKQKHDIYLRLGPTLNTIKLKNSKTGNICTIIYNEKERYARRYNPAPELDNTILTFNKITQFVDKLNPEIKSKVKFRSKINLGYNAEKRFLDLFGPNCIEKVSLKSLKNTILESRLMIVTYPETVFSESMNANIPTILIIDKNEWPFSKKALQTFDDLKKNKIAFENFNEVNTHINKFWKDMDSWWLQQNVQNSRKNFLNDFYNVKPHWDKEWSDYIHSSHSFN